MKHSLIVLCFLALLPALASGQEADRKETGRGYVFFAPGVAFGGGSSSFLLHFGGGGEANLYKGLGFGSEIGYLGPWQYMSQGVGLLSVNCLYNFKIRNNSKMAPFVTGGYSLLFRSGHLNAMNFGAGVNYWFGDRIGMRFEARDHVNPQYFSDHFLQGRIGLVFR